MKGAVNRMGATKLALAYGRSLELRSGDADTLQVRSATGEVEVTIVITPDGPSVRLRAVDIEVEAARAIRMRCETFDLQTSGDARIAAAHGGVTIHACDDVDLRGERVLLNADVPPMPATWEAFEESCARRAAASISPNRPGTVEREASAPDSVDSDG
ncbi:MAG: hypothetical protein JNL21_00615 [Myxococcales bacterium]|nr:hypothetical protein [Myxococcales bacterium]